MKLHKNATLTPKQRQEIQRLYATRQVSYPQLAQQFAGSRKTVIKWAKRNDFLDQSSAPKQHHQRVTDAYRLAVINYRQATPLMDQCASNASYVISMVILSPARFDLFLKQPNPKKPADLRWKSYPQAAIERKWTYNNCLL